MILHYSMHDIERLRDFIGEDLYERQRASRHLCVPQKQGFFLAFYYCDIADWKQEERVCICCTRDQLVFFGDAHRYAELVAHLPEEDSTFHALAQFFADLTAEDIDTLDRLEQEINLLEDMLISNKKTHRNISAHIVAKRRELLKIKRYYDQLDLILEQICENENDVLTPESVRIFASLARRVERLTELVIHLRECVTQAREAYQAQIDIEQNQIMKIFTVITAVFLPLTLIVGWYGMNFHMPEYAWDFGYLYVIVLSIIVCAICFFLFKKKKWF